MGQVVHQGAGSDPSLEPILEVKGLKVYFRTPLGTAKAVDGIDFTVGPKETVGLVGESGCGKSVTGLSVMGLVGPPGEVSGEINFLGKNLLKTSEEELRRVRGKELAMVFQEPMTALNPVMRVGDQVAEVVLAHSKEPKKETLKRAVELLKAVGIPAPEKRAREYPHQMSGGMRQRAMIAMALILKPQLLIADEPTTGLDVTYQAQILELLSRFKASGTSLILITHDLSVVAETSERVLVMYAGRLVEEQTAEGLFKNPLHPYTKGLMGSIPSLSRGKTRLSAIPGVVPSPFDPPKGCRFAPRCQLVKEVCGQEPELSQLASFKKVRCWLYA